MSRSTFSVLLFALTSVPIAAAAMPGLAQAPGSGAIPPEGYQVVMGDQWSFAVPSDWENVLANAPSKPENVSVDAQWSAPQRQTVMNLVTERYEGSSEDYIQFTLDNLSSLGLTVDSQQSITVGTLPGVDLEVTVPFANPPVQMVQRVIADEGTGFVMTCGGSAEDFETTRSVCANIFNSFQITP